MTTLFTLIAMGFLAAFGWVAYKLFLGVSWVLKRVFLVIGLLLGHVVRFVRNMVVDLVQTVGALLTAVVILPLALVNLLVGRLKPAGYYGKALEDELTSSLLGLYRVGLGHPLRLVGLGPLLTRIERRIPELVERAPRGGRFGTPESDQPRVDGYDFEASLPAGGSGAQLFVARPRPETLARMREAGLHAPDRVVVKTFAIDAGSTLPQIVRESRALESARRLGLVLDHELSTDRLTYVMPYVQGDQLGTVIERLHAESGPRGLDERGLAYVMNFSQDVLHGLQRFHLGGLWHKDVKPANVIVSGSHAHLVDFGLVTPLTSALTLTTHGTEYYRDPEMVRLAMQGVKVHEVDGVKFDIYGAGAVLFSMIENSFPAHGSLSRITKHCPEALAWVVQRAMAEMNERYATAQEMLDDLAVLAAAADPFALRPADLPSLGGSKATFVAAPPLPPLSYVSAARGGEENEGPAVLGSEEAADPTTLVPPKRRRRFRRVLAAVGLLAGTAIGLGIVADWRDEHRYRGPRVAHTSFSRLGNDAQRILREAEAILRDARLDDRSERSESNRVARAATLPYEGSVFEGRSTELDAAAHQPWRVLIVDDVQDPTDPDQLELLATKLEERGFEVLGLGDDDIELLAGARHAIGLSGADDDDAVDHLRRYLADTWELDAILWTAPAPGQNQMQLLAR